MIGIAKNTHATHHSIPRATIETIVANTFSSTFFPTTFGKIRYSSSVCIITNHSQTSAAFHSEPLSSHVAMIAPSPQINVPTVGTSVIVAAHREINTAYGTPMIQSPTVYNTATTTTSVSSPFQYP